MHEYTLCVPGASRIQETIRSHKIRVRDNCGPPCECWEQNRSPARTVIIPSYVLKSGETMANAGAASVSSSSAKSGSSSSAAAPRNVADEVNSKMAARAADNEKKSHSILYGVAKGLKFL